MRQMASEYSLERKLIQMGDSLMVTLPKVWIRAKGLQKGDRVLISFNSHEYLKLIPITEETEKKSKEVTS
jgi:antitoxin component of MazEF toxin-antitoxin module